MSSLPPPITWNQFNGPDAGNNSCGPHACASALSAAGLLPPSTTALGATEQYLGLGETDDAQLVSCLRRYGAPSAVSCGADYLGIAAALAAGRYVIPLVASDGLGHPVPLSTSSIRHWVCQYADGPVGIANSGSGQRETYDAAYWASCYAGVTIDTGCTPPEVVDTALNATQLLNIKRSMIWAVRLQFEDWPASQQEVDSYAVQIADDLGNYEAVITAMRGDFLRNGQPSLWTQVQALKARAS